MTPTQQDKELQFCESCNCMTRGNPTCGKCGAWRETETITLTEQDKEIRKEIISILRDSKLDIVDDADDIMQLIAAWHNKQVEELLDKLETSMRGKTIVDTAEGWQEFVRKHVNGAIEAERNKLKGVK